MNDIPFSNGNILMNCDDDGVKVTQKRDGLSVQTYFTPYETGAAAMALMTQEFRQEGRLRNSACRAVTADNRKASAICELYPVSLRSPAPVDGQAENNRQFSEKTAPLKAMMNIRIFDREHSDLASFMTGFTDFDLVALMRLAACIKPSGCLVIGLSLSVMCGEGHELALRCGGSEWRSITENERRRLVTKLRLWLTGDRSRHVTFNADNLHFNRRPRMVINGVSTHPLSFMEVAQLYLVLEGVSGRESGLENLQQDKGSGVQ